MLRKLKRKQLNAIIGKCRKCLHAYKHPEKERCDECQASREYINFKRRPK